MSFQPVIPAAGLAGWRFLEFRTLLAPFAFHHDRQPVDDDIQEAADNQGKSEHDGNKNRCRLSKQLRFLHDEAWLPPWLRF